MRHGTVERDTRNHRHHGRNRQGNTGVLALVQRGHNLGQDAHTKHGNRRGHMRGHARFNHMNTDGVRYRSNHATPHAGHRRGGEEHREAGRRNTRGDNLQEQIQGRVQIQRSWGSQRQVEERTQNPHRKRRAQQQQTHVGQTRNTREEVHTGNVEHARHHGEARHQEQHRRNETNHVVRANQTRRNQHIDNRNVQAGRQEAAGHPGGQVAHPALEKGRTQKLTGTGGEEHDRALHQAAAVQEREPGTSHRGGQRQHPAGVQRLSRIDAVQLGVRLRRGDAFGQLGDELAQLIDLVGVNAHRALLGHLGAEVTFGVRGGGNLGEGHLRVVLLQTHSLRQARHGRLKAVRARTRLHQDAAQSEHHLGLRDQVLVGEAARPEIDASGVRVVVLFCGF